LSQTFGKLTAPQRRQFITSSPAYKQWVHARRAVEPFPSDPYRAFMIDLALFARIQPHARWKTAANRLDEISIDYPRPWGQRAPTRPRLPGRKEEKRTQRRPQPEYIPPAPILTPLQKRIQQRVTSIAEAYHVPEPRIIWGYGSPMRSYYQGGFTYRRLDNRPVQEGEPFIMMGLPRRKAERKGVIAQTLAVASHETGHHIHARTSYEGRPAGSQGSYFGGAKVEKERAAWEIARKFLQENRPIQLWAKRYAMATYLGELPHGTSAGQIVMGMPGKSWRRTSQKPDVMGKYPWEY